MRGGWGNGGVLGTDEIDGAESGERFFKRRGCGVDGGAARCGCGYGRQVAEQEGGGIC